MKRPRVSVWVLPDQLGPSHPALERAESEYGRDRLKIVLVESEAWLDRLPYHKKRRVLILSAGRHRAEALRGEGYDVDVVAADDDLEGLKRHARRHKTDRVVTMEAAEYDRRVQQRSLGEALAVPVEVLPNRQFLVGRFNPVPDPEPGRRYVMESFYRSMRRHFGLLLEPDGGPAGGAWNYDAENRKRLPKGHNPPPVPAFEPDPITRQVMAEVERSGQGVGSVDGFDLAVTRADALAAFDDFLDHRLAGFGPFEDAMSVEHATLHHSVLSPYMNLGLLQPLEMAEAAEARYRAGEVPLNSAEGFVRQVVGWREFIYWQYHRQMPDLRDANSWGARRPLPQFFWDGVTDLACLRHVVNRLIDRGYTHHIERLMVVCNFCLLAGVDPAAVADWFLTFYIDSHDWVVLPNVIGMGLNADGGLTATKPYVASASYINKMSDYCGGCRYDPKARLGPDACPFNSLYWSFLIRNERTLRANPRLGPAVLGLSRINESERAGLTATAERFLASLREPTDGAPN